MKGCKRKMASGVEVRFIDESDFVIYGKGFIIFILLAITMPLQCPITLADTYRLKCADLSGIRFPLITISKNNFSEIHIDSLSLLL